MLDELLAATPHPFTTLRAWFDATAAVRRGSTIDRALLGGAHADRLACAFAAGYSEALRALVPSLEGIGALCATEADGAHPRAIRTRLEPIGDRFRVTGSKKWATAAAYASALLVVASIGDDPATGRNRLRLVHVPTSAPNLHIKSSAAPFVPEIEHAEIELAGVEVPASAILPGDGYDDYLKPFRTIEDLHVHAALVGYLLTVARVRAWSPALVEVLAALACAARSLGDADVKSPATHLALAGLMEQTTRVVAEVEREWSASNGPEWQRWQRDRPLLQVAAKARNVRRDNARAALLATRS